MTRDEQSRCGVLGRALLTLLATAGSRTFTGALTLDLVQHQRAIWKELNRVYQ